jgi:hydrogenase/urease accessory protein HupE
LRILGYVVGQELQGHETAKLYILGFVHHPHATATQLLDDAVVRYGAADHWRESYVGGKCKSMKPENELEKLGAY